MNLDWCWIGRWLSFAALAFTWFRLLPLAMAGAEVDPRPMPVVDLHVDLSYQHNYKHRPFALGSGQFVASSLLRAGVVGVVLPLYVPRNVSDRGPRLSDIEHSLSAVTAALRVTPPYASVTGCNGSSRTGDVRTWFALEGSGPLADDAQEPARLAERGVRVFGLVHTYDNELASTSSPGGDASEGLTPSGRAAVNDIFAANGLVDVSHASAATVDDVLALAIKANRPAIATHSNARELADHHRNLTDAQIGSIAKSGGIIGVNFHSPFVRRGRLATLNDVVEQVLYLVKRAGSEHVAIGSDFEGDIRPPRELRDATRYQVLARALRRRGLPEETLKAVFATNALRLLCGEPFPAHRTDDKGPPQ